MSDYYSGYLSESPQFQALQAQLDWWHELIHKHHDNEKCPDLKTYVENMQGENINLQAQLTTSTELIEALRGETAELREANGHYLEVVQENTKLQAENAKLNIILYHRENGLSHSDFQKEIDTSRFAELLAENEGLVKEAQKWEDACTEWESKVLTGKLVKGE